MIDHDNEVQHLLDLAVQEARARLKVTGDDVRAALRQIAGCIEGMPVRVLDGDRPPTFIKRPRALVVGRDWLHKYHLDWWIVLVGERLQHEPHSTLKGR